MFKPTYYLLLLLMFINFPFSLAASLPFNQENSGWELYTHRKTIRDVLYAGADKTLWVATEGGLEQRDYQTGALLQVFTNLDGLPYNSVMALATDEQHNIWVGTEGGGLARYSKSGSWTYYTDQAASTTVLPNNYISALLYTHDGLWVGMQDHWGGGGLAWLNQNQEWTYFTTENSDLPGDSVHALADDGAGGVWIATLSGLAHSDNNNVWSLYQSANSPLPDDSIQALAVADSGLWIGTQSAGLAHLDQQGNWSFYSTENSLLPDNWIESLAVDANGGLWVGMSWQGGLAYRAASGEWQLFNHYNSGLPANYVLSLLADADGSLLVGTEAGMVRLTADLQWLPLPGDENGLPHNSVLSLLHDAQQGLWIGMEAGGGLSYLSPEGELQQPDYVDYMGHVNALIADGAGGIWAGNNGGLVHRSASGEYTLYNLQNSDLPDNLVTALALDDLGGLWVGTGLSNGSGGNWQGSGCGSSPAADINSRGGGLAYRDSQDNWTVFNQGNTPLPGNYVKTLLTDDSGGIWVGLSSQYQLDCPGGLAYRNASGTWQVYQRSDNSLPGEFVHALAQTSAGLWVGFGDPNATGDSNLVYGGLALFNTQGQWQHYSTSNSALPDNRVMALLADDNDGLWIGMSGGAGGGGLSYRSAMESWLHLNSDSSGLPDDSVTALQADNTGGLWIATQWSGIAHLGFGEKVQLSQLTDNTTLQNSLLHGERAAIIIHPRGSNAGYQQAAALDFMASYAYHTLHARGYDNQEIYFLSYQPSLDVNADAYADANVIDAPVTLSTFRAGENPRDLTLDDVSLAFEWAKQQGSLDEPLIIFFIDHGIPGGLLLDPQGQDILSTAQLKTWLDDYQQHTGNALVLVVEACHSGTLVSDLAAEQRLIISSTDEDLAYYDDLGRSSFLKLYLDQLRQGATYQEAMNHTRQLISGYRKPLNRQNPQLEDSRSGLFAKQHCLNGCFGALPGMLTLTVNTPPAVVAPGESMELQVETQIPGGSVRSVWASVVTPEVASQRTENGYSRLPTPVVYLRRSAENTWSNSFSDFSSQGDYVFSIKAEDNSGFVTESQPLLFSVPEGQALAYPDFDALSNRLLLPAITIPQADDKPLLYQAEMLLDANSKLVLDTASLQLSTQAQAAYVNYIPLTQTLLIPELPFAGMTYSLELKLDLDAPPPLIQFDIEKIELP